MSQEPNTLPSSPGSGERGEGGSNLFRLLRHSHIFASAVREVLEQNLVRQVSPDSLTVSQFQLLKLTALKNGHHQVGQVAEYLGVSAPAATKNIDKLEKLGLIIREPSKGDRRATFLAATPKGRRLVRRYESRKAALMAPVVGSFEAAELALLTELLERFSVSLLRQDEPYGDPCCLRCSAYIEQGCPVSQFRGGCPYQKGRHTPIPEAPAKEAP